MFVLHVAMLVSYSKDHVEKSGQEIFCHQFRLSNMKVVIETALPSEETISLVETHLVKPFPEKKPILPPLGMQSLWKDADLGFMTYLDLKDQEVLPIVEDSVTSGLSRKYLSIFWFLPQEVEDYKFSVINYLKGVLRGLSLKGLEPGVLFI